MDTYVDFTLNSIFLPEAGRNIELGVKSTDIINFVPMWKIQNEDYILRELMSFHCHKNQFWCQLTPHCIALGVNKIVLANYRRHFEPI